MCVDGVSFPCPKLRFFKLITIPGQGLLRKVCQVGLQTNTLGQTVAFDDEAFYIIWWFAIGMRDVSSCSNGKHRTFLGCFDFYRFIVCVGWGTGNACGTHITSGGVVGVFHACVSVGFYEKKQ